MTPYTALTVLLMAGVAGVATPVVTRLFIERYGATPTWGWLRRVAVGAMGAIAFLVGVWGNAGWYAVLSGVLGTIIGWCAIIDAQVRKIPDILSVAAATAVVAACASSTVISGDVGYLTPVAIGGMVFAVLYAVGVAEHHFTGHHTLGFGDVKLLSVAAAWWWALGLPAVLAGVAGFALTLVGAHVVLRRQGLPAAVFIAVGCVAAVAFA